MAAGPITLSTRGQIPKIVRPTLTEGVPDPKARKPTKAAAGKARAAKKHKSSEASSSASQPPPAKPKPSTSKRAAPRARAAASQPTTAPTRATAPQPAAGTSAAPVRTSQRLVGRKAAAAHVYDSDSDASEGEDDDEYTPGVDPSLTPDMLAAFAADAALPPCRDVNTPGQLY